VGTAKLMENVDESVIYGAFETVNDDEKRGINFVTVLVIE